MENNQNNPIEIDPTVLAEQVQKGMKKKELAAHYGLSVVKMGEALKQCGLKIRQFHAPKFIIKQKSEPVSDTSSDQATATEAVVEEVKDQAPIENKEPVWD